MNFFCKRQKSQSTGGNLIPSCGTASLCRAFILPLCVVPFKGRDIIFLLHMLWIVFWGRNHDLLDSFWSDSSGSLPELVTSCTVRKQEHPPKHCSNEKKISYSNSECCLCLKTNRSLSSLAHCSITWPSSAMYPLLMALHSVNMF